MVTRSLVCLIHFSLSHPIYAQVKNREGRAGEEGDQKVKRMNWKEYKTGNHIKLSQGQCKKTSGV